MLHQVGVSFDLLFSVVGKEEPKNGLVKRCAADREGVTGGSRRVHNDDNTENVIICIPHKVFDNKQVKENELGATRSTHDELIVS